MVKTQAPLKYPPSAVARSGEYDEPYRAVSVGAVVAVVKAQSAHPGERGGWERMTRHFYAQSAVGDAAEPARSPP